MPSLPDGKVGPYTETSGHLAVSQNYRGLRDELLPKDCKHPVSLAKILFSSQRRACSEQKQGNLSVSETPSRLQVSSFQDGKKQLFPSVPSFKIESQRMYLQFLTSEKGHM